MHPTIGVLALQGAFAKHIEMLKSLGVNTIEVRHPEDLAGCDALIIPGGESTVISRQMHFIHFEDPLRAYAQQKPIFGTCAGLILMSKEVVGATVVPFGMIHITVERNAFGRQAESFKTKIECSMGKDKSRLIPAIFIRAPRIKSCGSEVKVIGIFEQEPVLVQQGKHLAATFHPELTEDATVHRYFLSIVKEFS